MKKKIFDLESEITETNEQIKDLKNKTKNEKNKTNDESQEIEDLLSDVNKIANQKGITLQTPKFQESQKQPHFEWCDEFFLNNNPFILESRIRKEIFQNPKLLPKLNQLDIVIVSIAGIVASLLDYLVVKIPKDINYLGKFQQEGSEFTKWLKTIGINEKGKLNQPLKWFEKVCKVPYDTSTNKFFQNAGGMGINGLTPRQHRLLSLGHDPLFGLIFGIFDIFNGSLTAIDTSGKIQILKTLNTSVTDKIFAPFLWIGHIVSDICTKAGIPIPGWGFLQIMQFGSMGEKNRTIADISRWMYLNGYDLRHFLTMAISTASIEIIIRAYHYLSNIENKEQLKNSTKHSISSRELSNIQFNLKLHKMLFLSHSIAAGGNALKIFSYQGNPLAINIPQWLMFAKESVKMGKAILRDKTPEKIDRNRTNIDKEWDEIRKIEIGDIDLLTLYSSIYKKMYQK
ncbi:MAG: hypothetical protein H8E98_01260 [Bacteroidetes bacterium]|nr:hypothetical protein [Bacteroidota bacterium]